MERFRAKIHQLNIEQTTAKKNFTRAFIAKPARDLERRYGVVFGLLEYTSKDPVMLNFIDLIIDETKTAFYYTEPKNQRDEDDAVDVAARLEDVLRQTNAAITNFLESEQIQIDVGAINATVGVMYEQEVHFAHVGTINGFLLFHRKNDEYRIIPIAEPDPTGHGSDPLKFFSQVISGKVRKQDMLLFTTDNVLDYFSLNRLKNILGGQLLSDGMNELEELLLEANAKENFGLMIIEVEPMALKPKTTTAMPVAEKEKIETFDYRTAAKQDSMRELIKTEYETEKLLTPSLMPEIKKYVSALGNAFKEYGKKTRQPSTRPNTPSMPPKKMHRPTPNMAPKQKREPARLHIDFSAAAKQALSNMRKVSAPVMQTTQKTANQVRKIPLAKMAKQIVIQVGAPLWNTGKQGMQRLPKSSRRILIISALVVIGLGSSIWWLLVQQQAKAQAEAFTAAIETAEQVQVEAQASLIYRDEAQARSQLSQAESDLNALTPANDQQRAQLDEIKTSIATQLRDLRHIVEINDPVLLTNFKNLNNQSQIANFAVRAGQEIITQDLESQAIYTANTQDRSLASIQAAGLTPGSFVIGVALDQNRIILINRAKASFEFLPESETLRPISLSINDNTDIKDATSYIGRLYLLDAASGEIFRYTPVGSGLGSPSPWLTGGQDLVRGATSLAIDGSVYVLQPNGSVVQFTQGQPTDFSSASIDPPLQQASKIRTSVESSYLYILDSGTQRVVVLDKTGKLVAQYVSDQFTDLKDMIIDEVAKSIYVLNGSQLFGIPATHLSQ